MSISSWSIALVVGDDLLGERVVALDQRLHGAADLLLGVPAHGQELVAQRAQLALELPARVSLFHAALLPELPGDVVFGLAASAGR